MKDRFKTTYSWKKSYAKNRRRDRIWSGCEGVFEDFTYERSDEIRKVGEFRSLVWCPYEVSQRVGKVAYELRLPSELSNVHPLFHVYIHKKCIGDPMSILSIEGLNVDESISYEDVPAEIHDRQVMKLMT